MIGEVVVVEAKMVAETIRKIMVEKMMNVNIIIV